jgi:hypothetical protein
MQKSTIVKLVAASGLFVSVLWASTTGFGAPQPEDEPMSVREESARGAPLSRGHHRTRFFLIGGGIHGGK